MRHVQLARRLRNAFAASELRKFFEIIDLHDFLSNESAGKTQAQHTSISPCKQKPLFKHHSAANEHP